MRSQGDRARILDQKIKAGRAENPDVGSGPGRGPLPSGTCLSPALMGLGQLRVPAHSDHQ